MGAFCTRDIGLKLSAVILLCFGLGTASAMMSTSDEGLWPRDWPKSLEPFRKQARTIDVGTGIQQQIHEITFKSEAEFARAWPDILKLKTPGAPVTFYWTNRAPPKAWGSLLNNSRPVVRIYTPTYGHTGGTNVARNMAEIRELVAQGKMLHAGPPWPPGIVQTNGSLPEYVSVVETNGVLEWVPADFRRDRDADTRSGFYNRARIDLDVVLDEGIIKASDLRLPTGTPVHCDQLPVPELTREQKTNLVEAARQAFSKHVGADPKTRKPEIAEKNWGAPIRDLKPLRVVDDRVNIKVVLAEHQNIEAGFYINQYISSSAPQPSDFLEWVPISETGVLPSGTIYRYKLVR